MRCRKAQKLISAAFDGELSEARDQDLRKHLASCAECQAFAADVARCGDGLAWLTAPEPRWGFADRVLARIAAPEPVDVPQRRWLDLLRPAPLGLGASAFCLGVLLAVLVLANGQGTAQGAKPEDGVAVVAGDYFDTLSEVAIDEQLLALLPDAEE